jgi:hypothetical protein
MTNPPWTTQELDILFAHNTLSDAKLADQLPGRTADAVGATREAIHTFYHKNKSTTFYPSQVTQKWIAEHTPVICPRCGEKL